MHANWLKRSVKLTGVQVVPRQRIGVLFLCVLMLAGVGIPTASVYAEARQVNTSPPVDIYKDKKEKQAPIPKDKQKLPAPIKETDSAYQTEESKRLSPAPHIDRSEKLPTIEEAQKKSSQPADLSKRIELTEKREAAKEVFQDTDGTITERHYAIPKFYQKDGQWKTADMTLVEDKNAADSGNVFGRALGQAQSLVDSEQAFVVKENGWQARFGPSDFEGGMIRVKEGNSQVGFAPVDAKRVAPVITTDQKGKQTVNYYDIWPGVNLEYTVHTNRVKLDIVLKDRDAMSEVAFEVKGASLEADAKDPGAFKIKGALGEDFGVSPINLQLKDLGLVDEPVYKQEYIGNKLRISVDKQYLRKLPSSAYPVIVDPSIGAGYLQNYTVFKSDGYVCSSAICDVYGGTNQGPNWRHWRTGFHADYSALADPNKDLIEAGLFLSSNGGYSGAQLMRTYYAGCMTNFNCLNLGLPGGTSYIDTIGWLDVTGIYQTLKATNDFNGHLMLVGDECACNSFKSFDPSQMYLQFRYSNHPPIPTPQIPTNNPNTEFTVVSTQPMIGVSGVTDTDSTPDPVRYGFEIQSANGVVIYQTTLLDQNRITIPEGLLQDGGIYRWNFMVADTYWASPWQLGGAIRVDLRTGKDKTSTYDTIGPISASLNNGNAYTAVDTHSVKALDGSIGLNLNYNSPLASRMGLRAEYYTNTTHSGDPALRRTEATIDNDWALGTPAQGVIGADNFSATYKGYFVAPETGTYYFGARVDDLMTISVNNQQVFSNGGCGTACFGSAVSLTAGQTVRFEATYAEATGNAYAQIFVKGQVAEQIIPTAWLRTDPMPTEHNTGLTGHYYTDNGSHDPTQLTNKLMTRQDPSVNFIWDVQAPIPGLSADNFYVRWEGYFMPAATGTYNFGVRTDDGGRVTINNTERYAQWAGGAVREGYDATGVYLTAGTPVPIKVEFFEVTGTATAQLLAKTPYQTSGGVVDPQHLSPGGKFLPAGWSISADADGNLAYERLEVRQNGDVIMYDADGSTQLFTNTGSGFRPPVNEDAYLVRNADSTYSLTDADGRIYIFNVDGTLRETSTPIDDRKPAAIKYVYATQNGIPKLTEIIDGVDSTRKGNLYYQGDTQCATPPSGFSAPPTANLCAFITYDGQRTDFFYDTNGRLARISMPGNAAQDMGYDSQGMLTSIRDVVANDAVAAGVRTNDATVLTELTYDNLARVSGVKAPAATTGASRMEHTLQYLVNTSRTHITGATEPNGYTQHIEYDNLLRTTKACDIAALCDLTEWHASKDLSLSTTDEAGLKTTTLYNETDKPTHQYGPAPAAWFDANRVPLTTYTAQVPHTETAYDEGIAGAAVSWQDYRRPGTEPGVLYGAPKLHTTGLTPSTPGLMSADLVTSPPITAGTGMQGIGLSATGKLHLANGTYYMNAEAADGVRVWIDDQLIIDSWQDSAYRTVGNTVSFTVNNNSPKRFRLETYRRTGVAGAFNLFIRLDGVFGWTNNWVSSMTPDYGLATTSKTYDATIGDTEVKTSYGTNPELGLSTSSTLDQAGLNYTTASTYEAPGGTNSYLRQLTKTLPGGTATNYAHYDGTETRDNPCTTATEAYRQAGAMKLKTEADPDGAGSQVGRTTETIYDDAGRVVATRLNNDAWTCTSYDARGRVTETKIPAQGSEPARTVTNDWSVGGIPLTTSTTDSSGTIQTETDLLGRTTYYRDSHYNETWTTYDALGRISGRTGTLGTEVSPTTTSTA